MNKVWSMVLSGALIVGISFNSAAMTQSELAAQMASSAETSHKKAQEFQQDFERIIKARTAEGKSVKIQGFGTFSQGEKATRMVADPRGKVDANGATVKYIATTWHKVKSTGSLSHNALLNELAATGRYSKAEASRLLDSKTANTKVALKKGDALSDIGGLGMFYTKNHRAKTGFTPTGTPYTSTAKNVVKFKASTVSAGMKFTPAKAFRKSVN